MLAKSQVFEANVVRKEDFTAPQSVWDSPDTLDVPASVLVPAVVASLDSHDERAAMMR